MFANWRLFCGTLIVLSLLSTARAEGEGQADLDAATQAKLDARTLGDLGRVVDLCETAIRKGLDKDNERFATELLTATLFQRADQYAASVFQRKAPRASWPQLTKLAMNDVEKLIRYNDQFGRAYHLRARLRALSPADREQARQDANRAIELLQDDNRVLAEALLLRGRLSEDEERRLADFNAAVAADPNNIDALRARGVYYLSQKEFEKAVGELSQVIERNPKDLAALQAVAEAFVGLKKYDEAAQQLKRIIELQPQSPAGYLLRAQLSQTREDLNAALADLDKVIDLDVNNLLARMMRARIYSAQDKNDLAKADLERIIERNPRFVEAILLRSMIFAREGNFAAAITDLNQIARALPDNVPIQLQLAAFYAADDRPSKAIEIYDKIVAADAQNSDAIRGRGDAKLAIGEHASAISDYEAALKLNAKDETLLNNFAWVLATSPQDNLRDGKRAIDLATKACEQTEYQAAHILSTLAAAYAETGDFETARKWSAKAVELGEGDVKEQLREELETYQKNTPFRERKTTKEEPEPEPPREDDLFID